MESGIYKILNTTNGKFYIGSAVNLTKRKAQHFNMLYNGTHPNIILQRAYDKYGHNSFEFIIVEDCNIEDLITREQSFIDTLYPSYNICPNAGSRIGTRHSEETKEKMRLKKLGRKLTPEHIRNNAIARIGSKRSLETRLTMNQHRKIISDETVRNIKIDIASGMKNRHVFAKYPDIKKSNIMNIKYGVNRTLVTI